jgi:ribosome production factor 2
VALRGCRGATHAHAMLWRRVCLFSSALNACFLAQLIAGHTIGANGKKFLDEMAALKQPNVVKLGNKKANVIVPFDDESKIEFLAHKNDASLFMLGTNSKKRPDNVVLGRTFDFHILDMVEVGIVNLRPASSFTAPAPGIGMRPCFVFCGDEFDSNPVFQRLANLFLDFFGGRPTNMINLRGLENVVVLTAVGGVIHFRHYSVALQKSGDRVPRVELEEVGPSFEMRVGRSKLATEEQWRQATPSDGRKKDPSKPRKNVEVDTLGSSLGTVHVGKQDLTTLILKKGRALKEIRREADAEEGDDDGEGDKRTNKKKKSKVAAEATDI